MRVFVTGVKGQLGHDVMNELAKRGHEGIGVDIEEMDITDAESVRKVITEANPDVVIHCAAWTAVDLAEDDDKKEKVHQVNAVGTENIAKVCHDLDCKMIYISTDYVFDGHSDRSVRHARRFVLARRTDDRLLRSEERRVGKECRSRWSPYH